MSKRLLFGFLILMFAPHGGAYGQLDGACNVQLTLDADSVANIQDILSFTTSGFGPSDHAIAAPLTNNSPIADGEITPDEYPNICHYSFADDENPGRIWEGSDPVNDDNDLSLNLHLAHTDQFLFLGFEATDEFIDMDPDQAAWNNDGVEFNINPDLEIGDGDSNTLEAFKVTGDVTGNGDVTKNNRVGRREILEGLAVGPPGDDQFVSAGKPSATGWVLEFQLPLAALDTDDDQGGSVVPAETGDVMLINFAVNDNDVEGGDQGGGTHALLWFLEDDPRSPQGGKEEVWVTPLVLTPPAGDVKPALWAGDADQDFDFDQLDLVKVQIAAKYLSGQAATWGEGDWNGAPGGEQGSPPAGNGFFDQIDIIAALAPGHYLTGTYPAIKEGGTIGDEQTTLVYDTTTGELSVDSPASKDLTSININSAGAKFIGDKPAVLDGAFDNFAADNIFKATFGGSFGDISFGNVLPVGLNSAEVAADLTAVGSLAGGGDLGDVDLVWVPEPSTLLMTSLGILGILCGARNRRRA